MLPTQIHYKQTVLDRISQDSDPNDRHIKEWTATHIQPKRLLRDMQREGLIKIEHVWEGKTCRRKLTALVNRIVEQS